LPISFLLVERTNDELKLRIGKHAAQPENSRGQRSRTRYAEEKRIDRVRVDGEIAAAIAARHRELADWSAARLNEWKILRINSRSGARCPATAKNAMRPRDVELPKQPVGAQLFQVRLVDLDELRFDLDLFGPGNIRLLHNRIDQLQIIRRVPNNEAAALRQEVRARARHGERHALALEKFFRALAIHQLVSAGGFHSILG